MTEEGRDKESPEEESGEAEELNWEEHEGAAHAIRGWPEDAEEVGEDDPDFEEIDRMVWGAMKEEGLEGDLEGVEDEGD